MWSERALDPGAWEGDPDAAVRRAMRVVLAVALDRDAAVACLDCDGDEAVALWPSSLYALLAAAVVDSPAVRARCRRLVTARLGAMVARFEGLSPAELARHFVEGRDVLSTCELAALVWTLVWRARPELGYLIARLGAELEVIATQNGVTDPSRRSRYSPFDVSRCGLLSTALK